MNQFFVAVGFTLLGAIAIQAGTKNKNKKENDSTKVVMLKGVEVADSRSVHLVNRLSELHNAVIFSGKKNEVISVATSEADLSTNNARQVFAKVPGATIWESDGSGIQIGIATRGLSANRSWEFNVRQNGYDISAEAFGYPEAYYNPPMEAVENIEIVRGAASLAYGPQFGGLLNYVLKQGSNKAFEVESKQTIGSYGLFNSYNAIGGTVDKCRYYAFAHYRTADGWRANSEYDVSTLYGSVQYAIAPTISIGAQYTRMSYISQQPGGLSDSLFALDAQQSLRDRNWFNAPWNVAALTFTYTGLDSTTIDAKIFGTFAERNSVGYVRAITIADSINASTQTKNPRQVDRDAYNNIGVEVRVSHVHSLFGMRGILSGGVRAYNGETERKQLGIGSTGSDFDLSIQGLSNGKEWGRDLLYTTKNASAYVEHLFALTDSWSITPGIRYEWISASGSGYINTSNTGAVQFPEKVYSVVLAGVSTEYKIYEGNSMYGGVSQSFRPVTFSDLTPSATTDIIDANLLPMKGANAELGIRGTVATCLSYDVGLFYLHYANRIGSYTTNGVQYKTNIGTSVSKGVEAFAELNVSKALDITSQIGTISIYASYGYVDARYTEWNNPTLLRDGPTAVLNKKVENAPTHSLRSGLSYSFSRLVVTLQHSSVSEVFTDATNTTVANASATTGLLPGYSVLDCSASYSFSSMFSLRLGVNNVADSTYATRRAGGYPGPGLLPANGRTMFATVGINL